MEHKSITNQQTMLAFEKKNETYMYNVGKTQSVTDAYTKRFN